MSSKRAREASPDVPSTPPRKHKRLQLLTPPSTQTKQAPGSRVGAHGSARSDTPSSPSPAIKREDSESSFCPDQYDVHTEDNPCPRPEFELNVKSEGAGRASDDKPSAACQQIANIDPNIDDELEYHYKALAEEAASCDEMFCAPPPPPPSPPPWTSFRAIWRAAKREGKEPELPEYGPDCKEDCEWRTELHITYGGRNGNRGRPYYKCPSGHWNCWADKIGIVSEPCECENERRSRENYLGYTKPQPGKLFWTCVEQKCSFEMWEADEDWQDYWQNGGREEWRDPVNRIQIRTNELPEIWN